MKFLTALFKSKENRFLDAAIEGDTTQVRKLLQKHPELLETEDGQGKTALYFSIANGRPSVAKELLANGANVNPPRCSPLQRAIERGREKFVGGLIKHGADVNHAPTGVIPLSAAIEEKNVDITGKLLNAGAKPDDQTFLRALILAKEAARHRDLFKNSSENQQYEQDWSKISLIIDQLVEAGANLHVKAREHQNSGLTVLHYAAEIGDTGLAEKAIDAGVDVNSQDEWGIAPLSIACIRGDSFMCHLLLRKHADVEIEEFHLKPGGATSLHWSHPDFFRNSRRTFWYCNGTSF